MSKFKVGDIITPKIDCNGFHEVKILKIDEKNYHVKIINGVATIPIHTIEENYQKL